MAAIAASPIGFESLTIGLGGAAVLFGGLMLSPDLDLHSLAYKRWGPLRFIWLPYRKLKHRSVWSHGPVAGTLGRLVLLFAASLIFVAIPASFVLAAFDLRVSIDFAALTQSIDRHTTAFQVVVIGIELSAIAHVIADVLASAARRRR
jgi:uncharacterized metal-binding protein